MKKQNLDEIQKEIDVMLSDPALSVKYFPPFQIMAMMMEESGEIAREVSHLYGHKKKKDGEQTEGLKAELGDLLFAMVCLANQHGISLQEAMNMKLEKFRKRDAERFKKKDDQSS